MEKNWTEDPLNLPNTWIGCLVRLAPAELRPDEWPAAAAQREAHHAAPPRSREQLVDGLLAVVYVAACAALGLAGAVWL
jgi:hypothetical protein